MSVEARAVAIVKIRREIRDWLRSERGRRGSQNSSFRFCYAMRLTREGSVASLEVVMIGCVGDVCGVGGRWDDEATGRRLGGLGAFLSAPLWRCPTPVPLWWAERRACGCYGGHGSRRSHPRTSTIALTRPRGQTPRWEESPGDPSGFTPNQTRVKI